MVTRRIVVPLAMVGFSLSGACSDSNGAGKALAGNATDASAPPGSAAEAGAEAGGGGEAVSTHTVRLREHAVVYSEVGAGEPAVLFVHGGISDRSVWSDAMSELAPEHRTLALDLPGHGESDRWSDYAPDVFADAVVAVLDDAEVERAVLVGHSFGVSAIRDVALDHPSRVTALFLVDGFLIPLGGSESAGAALAEPFRSSDWEMAADQFIEQFMLGPETSSEVADRVRNMMGSGSQDQWLAVLDIATSDEIVRDEMIDVPTHSWFTGGATFPPQYETHLNERFDDITIDFAPEGSGHFLMWEHPDEFLRRLRSLVAQVATP